jgi:uncharacterized YigZ family protein
MSADSYLTIAARSEFELKVNRSRFIATAIPVAARAEAEEQHQAIARQYHDANHNCFAYRVGLGDQPEFRYSDDGEPGGTAGKPIYESINHFELTDLLLVVTRYFGGVKLGTGGLARAYRDCARGALERGKIVERILTRKLRVRFEHEQTSVVMRILSEFELKPESTSYDDSVTIVVSLRLSLIDSFRELVQERSLGKVNVEEI